MALPAKIPQASLAASLARRRQILSEATGSARVRGDKKKRLSKSATITSQSLAAMQSRALRAFQRSVARLQALTDDDFEKVASLDLLSDANADAEANADKDGSGADARNAALLLTAAATAVPPQGSEQASRSSGIALDDFSNERDAREREDVNPTPSLSASLSPPRRPPLQTFGSQISNGGGDSTGDEKRNHRAPEENLGVPSGEENAAAATQQATSATTETIPFVKSQQSQQAERSSSPPISSVSAAVVLRVLRATVLVLGGCGLGALPSDRDLWEAVKPMLEDGSLRHRVRHFDRRVRRTVVLDESPPPFLAPLLGLSLDSFVHDKFFFSV